MDGRSSTVWRVSGFLELHHQRGAPLLVANPWDRGSARLLESLGFKALATTSSGFAATLGRLDYALSRDEALAYAQAIAEAVAVPVTADLEDGFADEPEAVAETIRMASRAGLAGGSIEDTTRRPDAPIHDLDLAVARIEAASAAAREAERPFVLTARAENHLHGRPDLADTIARLQAFEAAGADVLYAPGVTDLDEIRAIVSSVSKPVNVLVRPDAPKVAELADAGVGRISVGGAFAFAALGAVTAAARELLDDGAYRFLEQARDGQRAAAAAFASS